MFMVDTDDGKYILRCNTEENAYKDTACWLEKLRNCAVPVPQIISRGVYGKYSFLVLNYIPGDDIGKIYKYLSGSEKRSIAHEVIEIQNRVSKLRVSVESDWSWNTFIEEMLCRAEMRISKNGYFDVAKVSQVRAIAEDLSEYFSSIKPIPYLDDISTKNLLIENGRISGIIDVDWIGIGDMLTFVALTNVALLNMGCDTDYAEYLLNEIKPTGLQHKVFVFYSLMFCVDFMGERGATFLDKKVPVNREIIDRLNSIFEVLLSQFHLAL